MTKFSSDWTRRRLLQHTLGIAAGTAAARAGGGRAFGGDPAAPAAKAQIAVTLDLEMSRHYPTWDDLHWDYEKGNLNDAAKQYAVEAARRVKAHGGVVHFFAVGRVLEQENVDWLKKIHEQGHPIGNHTYDHVNVLAQTADQIQFRFQRAPWLIEGKTPAQVIRENIAVTGRALRRRVGVEANGFRAPGGFHNGLKDRVDLQKMLLDQGFHWVSSLYPPHPATKPGERPTRETLAGLVESQALAQPFRYPSGLVEVPMSPISDVNAFRTGRWKLDWYLEAVRLGVEWAVENRAVYDFLAHPSCLGVVDPEFRTIELIAELVRQAGPRASIVGLDAVARRAGAAEPAAPS